MKSQNPAEGIRHVYKTSLETAFEEALKVCRYFSFELVAQAQNQNIRAISAFISYESAGRTYIGNFVILFEAIKPDSTGIRVMPNPGSELEKFPIHLLSEFHKELGWSLTRDTAEDF